MAYIYIYFWLTIQCDTGKLKISTIWKNEEVIKSVGVVKGVMDVTMQEMDILLMQINNNKKTNFFAYSVL